MKSGRRPKNKTEGAAYDYLVSNGWSVTKRGWPDFFCIKDGQMAVVEVKPRRSNKLKWNQAVVMRMLIGHGVKCYRFDGDDGLVELHWYDDI